LHEFANGARGQKTIEEKKKGKVQQRPRQELAKWVCPARSNPPDTGSPGLKLLRHFVAKQKCLRKGGTETGIACRETTEVKREEKHGVAGENLRWA